MDISNTSACVAEQEHIDAQNAAVAHLPPELVFDILSYVYYGNDGIVDKLSLKACALVQSAWAEMAQQLLYREITVTAYPSGYDDVVLRAPIAPYKERGKHLGEMVRSLDIPVGKGTPALSPESVVALLRSLPRLYNLSITIVEMHEFEPSTVHELKQLVQTAGPQIRSLRFRRSGILSPILYQLLSVWPSIRFLFVAQELAAAPPVDPPGFSLQELSLNRNLPFDALMWLLSNSADSLQLLDLRDVPGSELGKYLAMNHGHRVRSLRWVHYNRATAELVRGCSRLEEVVMYTLPPSIWDLTLPRSVEHLSFRNPPWAKSPTLTHVLNAIPKLPKLRMVTADAGVRDHPDGPILQRLCDERSIPLAFDGKPPWILDDPVMPDKFPRGRSVSNFRLMN